MKHIRILALLTSGLLLSGCVHNEKNETPQKEKKSVTKKASPKKKVAKHAYARNWLTEDLTDYLA
ncbi:hypothetical protein K9K77_01865 [Candidatus Babeliales bacterium]|nr:hypothetical protein [Candidatus Babeliales bacterium]